MRNLVFGDLVLNNNFFLPSICNTYNNFITKSHSIPNRAHKHISYDHIIPPRAKKKKVFVVKRWGIHCKTGVVANITLPENTRPGKTYFVLYPAHSQSALFIKCFFGKHSFLAQQSFTKFVQFVQQFHVSVDSGSFTKS